MYYPFNEQRGAYKVLMRNRFIFIKNDLHPVMENIVLLHELGHDALHREEATKVGGFKEFEIFNMRDNRMEYEANLFAAQISLSDEDFLELAERGYDTQQIARTLNDLQTERLLRPAQADSKYCPAIDLQAPSYA